MKINEIAGLVSRQFFALLTELTNITNNMNQANVYSIELNTMVHVAIASYIELKAKNLLPCKNDDIRGSCQDEVLYSIKQTDLTGSECDYIITFLDPNWVIYSTANLISVNSTSPDNLVCRLVYSYSIEEGQNHSEEVYQLDFDWLSIKEN